MTKIEVLQSKNSQQAKIDVVIDKLVSYIKDYTKHELEDALGNEEQFDNDEPDYVVSYTDICDSIKHQINYNEENEKDTQYDSVNHPSYYADGNIEVIDYIEDKNLGYHLGTAVKYISRAGKKHEQGMTAKEKEIEDLRKAVWFINRKIEQLQKDE